MVGVVHIFHLKEIEQKLKALHEEIIKDPYFKGVPSINKSTTRCFHACKDLPEVRREVFRLLSSFSDKIKVQVVIRNKKLLAEQSRIKFQRTGKKVSQNEIYDDLIKRLFRNLLHKAQENRIVIARRGKTTRLEALESAVKRARENFQKKFTVRMDTKVKIYPGHLHEFVGLQIIDYYLWALQRMYERFEGRFFNYLKSQYSLIIDLDDKRNKPYGEYYAEKNPLELKKIMPLDG
jgi:hypothetical protein